MAHGRVHNVNINERKFTVREAAPKVGRAPKTLRAWISSGKLEHLNIHGRIFIPESAIQRVLDESFVDAA